MGGELTVVDEFGQRILHRRRHDLAAVTLRGLEHIHEIFRHDGVADAHVGEHRFREGADIEHAAAVIEPLQRRHRLPS